MTSARNAQQIWIDACARRAGYADGAALAAAHDLRRYRIEQLYRAATKELVPDIEAVTTWPKELRAKLGAEGLVLDSVVPSVEQRSNDGQTTKVLFRLRDGAEIETVLMEHHHERNTVCISSQAGCAYACAFCATGQAGFTRQLDPTEIFDQARFFAARLGREGRKITNIVFMGMGEPLANADAVFDAVALLNDPHGFGLGHRHITISTVGLVPQIERFADTGLQVNLAISLHAPNDEIRGRIMPVNRRYPLAVLMAAVEHYVAKTNRKVFFEYVMLAGINDSPAAARELAGLMRGPLYHVNLIPYNATPEPELRASQERQIWDFAALLEEQGVAVTVRTPMGRDIAAACGQLRATARR